MEAFHYRYHPLTLRAIEIVRSGELGKLVSVEAGYGGMGRPRDDIRWSLPLAGGALMDVGCYPVHLLRSVVGGEPTVAHASADQAGAGVDADMRIELEFADGVTGLVRTSMRSPEPYVYARFVGEDGDSRSRIRSSRSAETSSLSPRVARPAPSRRQPSRATISSCVRSPMCCCGGLLS